ncbi:MAG: HAMP domain-containing histidine kinase [Actinobacteria bacterium]|nr:HAMP domain-containing histidine kinase [Actinomycetota bacterium]
MSISIRKKITIWYVAILSASLIAYGLLIYFSLYFTLQMRDLQFSTGGIDFYRTLQVVASAQKENKSEEIYKINNPAAAQSSGSLEIGLLPDGGILTGTMLPKPPDVIKFYPFTPVLNLLTTDTLKRTFLIIASSTVFVIGVAASGGLFMTKKALKPIDDITNTVKDIDSSKLHKRLNFKGSDDEVVRLAKTFDGMLDKIESSFDQQKQFTQNASHELNTPLTIMRTNIDVILQEKNPKPKDYREILILVKNEIDRLSGISDDLLSLSWIDNTASSDFSIIDIKIITKKILITFENILQTKKIIINFKCNGFTDIVGIKNQIERLVFNLIDNSIKHGISGSEIFIDIYNDEKRENLIFEIKNQSDSIDEKDIPFLFERFYKTRKKSSPKGFGLGLAIIKKIVENHDGKIEVTLKDFHTAKTSSASSPVKNVVFRIKIPLL